MRSSNRSIESRFAFRPKQTLPLAAIFCEVTLITNFSVGQDQRSKRITYRRKPAVCYRGIETLGKLNLDPCFDREERKIFGCVSHRTNAYLHALSTHEEDYPPHIFMSRKRSFLLDFGPGQLVTSPQWVRRYLAINWKVLLLWIFFYRCPFKYRKCPDRP